MLFNSSDFLIFLILFIPVYYLALKQGPRWSNLFLAAGSLAFYSYWNVSFLLVIIVSVLANYSIYKFLVKHFHNRTIRKNMLRVGIVFNLSLLGVYKYVDFAIYNLNTLLNTEIAPLNIIMPLGISFFTFQQIAFLYDAASGKAEAGSLSEYFIFVTFFPQLIAGPIVHHKEMMPQFAAKKAGINFDYFAVGCYLFSIGLAKKVLLADKLSIYANDAFSQVSSLTLFDAWAGALAYTMQIYFDFSGYCDMAVGLGLLFGIKLPINFYSPYKAASIQEFWRRWHITLSRWLRDYLYVPLGGNRLGDARAATNGIIVFVLGGLWHGAAWTFVLWGLMHGLALAICVGWRKLNIKIPRPVGIILTFVFVVIAWVMFKAESVSMALEYYKAMFAFNGVEVFLPVSNFINAPEVWPVAVNNTSHFVLSLDLIPYLVVAALIVFVFKNAYESVNYQLSPLQDEALVISNGQIIAAAILFAVALSYLKTPSEFIYFNF